MNQSLNSQTRLFALSSALFALTLNAAGCGKKGAGSFVTQAKFQTSEENGQLIGDLKLMLNTSGVQLPSFVVPIADPKEPGRFYGAISMRDALGIGTELGVRIHLDEIPGLNGSVDSSQLPNGKPIPVALPTGVTAVAIPIQERSRAYVAFGERTALVGTAVVIREFDRLASAIGGTDLFFPFTGDHGIRGVAGLFSSSESGQSGLAVFVDVGPALQQVSPRMMTSLIANATEPSQLEFKSQRSLSRSQAVRLNHFMQELSRRGRRLRL
ncbi:MAG: hypothetical protein ACK5QT_10910 [Oligoflexia bacterium]